MQWQAAKCGAPWLFLAIFDPHQAITANHASASAMDTNKYSVRTDTIPDPPAFDSLVNLLEQHLAYHWCAIFFQGARAATPAALQNGQIMIWPLACLSIGLINLSARSKT